MAGDGADARLEAGERFGEYRVERFLGRGGMGVVYVATQLSLDRRVALKVIAPDLSADPDFRTMFRNEAQLAAALDHPNVLPVYHAGEGPKGELFVAMRLVEGGDLSEHLRRRGRLPPAEAVQVLAQVADALDAAHGAGMAHRDVKPANVLIERRDGALRAYLSDFGLAHRLSEARDGAGRAAGTPEYMAPEQIEGGKVDGRVDVYAFGCLAYRCLVGDVPYRRETANQVLVAHLNAPIPRPSAAVPGLPPALDAVVLRALEKDPERRVRSAKRLIADAVRALGVERVATRPEPRERTRIAIPDRPPTVRRAAPRPAAPRPAAPRPAPVAARPARGGGRAAAWGLAAALAALVAAVAAIGVPLVLAEREQDRDRQRVVERSLAGLRLAAAGTRGTAGLATTLPWIAGDDGGGEALRRLSAVRDDLDGTERSIVGALPRPDVMRRLLLRATRRTEGAAEALAAIAADPAGAAAPGQLATARDDFATALEALRATTAEARRRLERSGQLAAGDSQLIDALAADLVRAGSGVDAGFDALERRIAG